MKLPRVSVLMLAFNRPRLIGQAIKSIQGQTLKSWELIVVDDSFGDGTKKIVSGMARVGGQIKYFKRERRNSIASASNFGLKQAKGEYVAVLDDDDYWAIPQKLEKQVKFLDENPDYVGCGGGAIAIDKSGRELFRFLKPEQDEDIERKALYANPMINSTALFRRSAAEKAGFYDESLRQFADWDFWLRIKTEGKLYNFQEYFLYYRVWEEGSSFKNQGENARAARQITKRHRRRYPRFVFALVLTYLYSVYAYFPPVLKKNLNPALSRFKKDSVSRFS